MSNELAKLQSLAKKAGAGKVEKVDITIDGETSPFFFKRIGYLRAREILALPMEFSPMVDSDHPAVVTINPAKVPDRNLKLIVESLVDEAGNPFATAAEIAALPPELGDKLFEAAEKVNAVADGAVQEKEKNSATTDSGDSSSSSPTVAAAP